MVGWLSYPNFIYYIPSLAFLNGLILCQQIKSKRLSAYTKYLVVDLISFLFPLAIVFLYLKDRQLFIYDSVMKSGMFRGGGSFVINYQTFIANLSGFIKDLIFQVNSYSFELAQSDFSNYYPILTLFLVFILTIIAYIKNRKLRPLIIASIILIVFTIFVSSLTLDPSGKPGIRRYLSVLVGIYSLFGITWYYINSIRWRYLSLKTICITIYVLILVHHMMAYPININALDNQPSKYNYLIGNSTKEYIDLAIKTNINEDLYLNCKNQKGDFTTCRYGEMFGAVAGACQWNHLSCKSIYGYDIKAKKYILLSIQEWEKYYWEH